MSLGGRLAPEAAQDMISRSNFITFFTNIFFKYKGKYVVHILFRLIITQQLRGRKKLRQRKGARKKQVESQ
ncbi:MAG: hypothetical protein D3908_03625 [Candidatus Electrothrix sp. AUS4]|nr:hypothetical protein [Candidatus Electrothrix sp. AUS4]